MQKQVSFRNAWTLFHLANITRYLPGRIWGIVRLLSLSKRFGLSKTATASSLTLHVGIETALGGLIAMTLLFSKPMQQTSTKMLEKFSGHTLLLTFVVMGLLAGFLFCIPKLAEHARQLLKTLVPLLGNARLWVSVLASHSLLWICQGVAFFLFVRSFALVRWADIGILTACFAFAWLVGFLSFLTPGGLGIREGLLGLFLATYIPAPHAMGVALLCRLWMLSAEMVLAGTAFLLHRKKMFRNAVKHSGAIVLGSCFVCFCFIYLTQTRTETQPPQEKSISVSVRGFRKPLSTSQRTLTDFQNTDFYRTIVDNNLFRPLGWTPTRPREPYRLLGTLTPTEGDTPPKAILEKTTAITTVTLGDTLDADITIIDIQPKQVILEKAGQRRTLTLNSTPWIN